MSEQPEETKFGRAYFEKSPPPFFDYISELRREIIKRMDFIARDMLILSNKDGNIRHLYGWLNIENGNSTYEINTTEPVNYYFPQGVLHYIIQPDGVMIDTR